MADESRPRTPEDWDTFFHKHYDELRKLAKQTVRRRNYGVRNATADGLIQDCLSQVWIQLRREMYDPVRPLPPWAKNVMINYLTSLHRKRNQAFVALPFDPPDPTIDGQEKVDSAEQFDAMRDAIRNEMTRFAESHRNGRAQVHFPAVLWLELRRRVGEILGRCGTVGPADEYLAGVVPWRAEESQWFIKEARPTNGDIWHAAAPWFRENHEVSQKAWIDRLQAYLDGAPAAEESADRLKPRDARPWPQWVCRGRKLLREFAQAAGISSSEVCMLQILG